MKRFSIFSLTVVAAVTVTSLASSPVMANLQNLGNVIAQNVQRKSQVELSLSAAKQVEKDQKVEWQESGTRVSAGPGDVLRYTLKGQNKGNNAIKNMVLTQPIPNGMTYVMKSTTQPNASVTYSIDGGKSFVANPTVQVRLANGNVETKPAPANVYTHVRWQLNDAMAPGQSVNVSYQVVVR